MAHSGCKNRAYIEVSSLEEKGAPRVVENSKILFPLSQIGPIDESQRSQIIKSSRLFGKYDKIVDRESAFEALLAQTLKEEEEKKKAQEEAEKQKEKVTRVKQILGEYAIHARTCRHF